MHVVPRLAVSCLLLLGLAEGRLYGQLLVPRLLRQFSEVSGVNLNSGGIAQDKQGRLWIASDDGIARFDGRQFRVLHDPVVKKGDYYYHVLPTPDGRVWLKMGRGYSLSYVAPRQQRIIRLPDTTRLVRDYLAKYGFHCLFADARHTLWIGLKKKGLLKVNTQSFAVEHVVDRSLDIRGITQDRRGTVYFTTVDQGLFAYAPQTGQLTNYRHRDQDTTSLSSNATYGVQARPDGSILIGLVNEANVLSPATGRFRRLRLNSTRSANPLLDPYIYEFKLDSQGNAYFSTGPAAFRYTPQGTLQRIGFGSPTDYIEGLHVGTQNRLWVSAASQLAEYDLNQARIVPSLIFLSVVVNGTHLETNTTATQRLVYDTLGHPTLTVKENDQFSLRFSLMASKQSHTIRYRLDGYDKEWGVAENFEGTVSYQLPAGTYTFTVNRGRHTGGWEPTTTTMTVEVVPPFWKTGYALLLALLGVGGVGYYLIRTYRRRRQLRQQLALEQLEAANLRNLDELKTRFFGNVTHEFRTPLTLILHATEQLVSRLNTDWERERLTTINRNADQLARLITQMLDIAKMDAQKLDVQLRLGDPLQFIGQCVEGFANLANQRRIDLTFNTFIPDETLRSAESVRVGAGEQTYPFDDDKLGKIMYNLLSNALKFTPGGGSVRVSDGLTSDRQLLIRVQDTGIGIAADHINRIFDRFYQADASTTRRYEGTGIGLAYIRELTELLGGQVTVESVLGRGTTFTVTLPMLVTTAGVNRINPASPTTPPLISQPLPPPARAGAVITAPAADQPLVLVVEDNEELRAYMADQMRQDYQVQEAVDGRDGITQALAAIPDLIVSDVMMPYVDGYALVETLKNDERTSHIPIVVLTAKSSFESRMQGLYAGADDYLSKPFSFAELNTRIQNVLHTRQKWQHYLVATQTAGAQETTSVPLVGQMISGREEQFLTRLRQLILANLTDKVVDVDWLVEQARMSRTQLHRKLTALTNQSTTGFIHSVRLGKAQELLQMDEDELTIAEVAYRVGYTSPAYFSKMFNEHFGHPPTRLRG